MNHSANTTRAGFTLVEMLVVISIMTIVLALSFPMIGAMKRGSSASSGINTISVAIPSIRRYATSGVTFPNDLDPTDPGDQAGVFSGAAAIFTPAGEIRLTTQKGAHGARSDDFYSGSRLLEQHGPFVINEQPGSGLPQRELNGFVDIPGVDYLQLPTDTGVVGINRVSGGNIGYAAWNTPPLLLPPPFAVWFNQNGYLIATGWDIPEDRANDYQFVYYDGNYDQNYSVDNSPNASRNDVSGYNPDWYNPDAGAFNANNWSQSKEKYILPFEKIEAVVGVYVYSREAFQIAVEDGVIPAWTDTSASANNDRWNWMRENGQMLMFSKQTGALMRNRDQ